MLNLNFAHFINNDFSGLHLKKYVVYNGKIILNF